MSRDLSDLTDRMRWRVDQMFAQCHAVLLPIFATSVLRSEVEQAGYVARGTSWTMKSKHLPQIVDGVQTGKAEAIDVATVEIIKRGYRADDPDWERIGEIGEGVGLKWGVWKKNEATVPAWARRGEFINVDPGHFEYKEGA